MKFRYKIAGGIGMILALVTVVFAWYISHDSDCIPAAKPKPGSETMKAIRYGCFGGPEVLQLAEVSKPVPADHEIRVRIEAAAVNPLDWHYMRGTPYVMRLMGAGIGTPAASIRVGRKSVRSTRLSLTRPGAITPGQRTIIGTR